MADQLVAPSTIEGLEQLAQSVGQVTDLFYDWKKRSSQIQIPKYKKEVFALTVHLDNTCKAYEIALNHAARESEIGASVAGDAVDLMEQLLIPERLPMEIEQLRADLLRRMSEALEAAKQLKDKFGDVQRDLLRAKERVPHLKDEIQEYGDATVPTETKLLAAVAGVTAILFPPMAAKAKELRATASHKARLSAAQAALRVLSGIEPGLGLAIEAVGKLVDFWSRLSVAINATTPDQLLGLNSGILRKYARHWGEIQQQYSDYASAARLCKKRLEVKRENGAILGRDIAEKRGS